MCGYIALTAQLYIYTATCTSPQQNTHVVRSNMTAGHVSTRVIDCASGAKAPTSSSSTHLASVTLISCP